MRQILFDELSDSDIEKAADYLNKNTVPASLDGLFWVEFDDELLDEDQKNAQSDKPFCFAIELGDAWVKFEYLVRSKTNMRSEFTRYANEKQFQYIVNFSQTMIDDLNLQT